MDEHLDEDPINDLPNPYLSVNKPSYGAESQADTAGLVSTMDLLIGG